MGGEPPVPARPKVVPTRPARKKRPHQSPKSRDTSHDHKLSDPPTGADGSPQLSPVGGVAGLSPVDHEVVPTVSAEQQVIPTKPATPTKPTTPTSKPTTPTSPMNGVKIMPDVIPPSPPGHISPDQSEPATPGLSQSPQMLLLVSPTSTSSASSGPVEAGQGEGQGLGVAKPDLNRQQSSDHEGEKEDMVSFLASGDHV